RPVAWRGHDVCGVGTAQRPVSGDGGCDRAAAEQRIPDAPHPRRRTLPAWGPDSDYLPVGYGGLGVFQGQLSVQCSGCVGRDAPWTAVGETEHGTGPVGAAGGGSRPAAVAAGGSAEPAVRFVEGLSEAAPPGEMGYFVGAPVWLPDFRQLW